MAQGHPELDWLTRRRDGESAPLIAQRDGVSVAEVRRATRPYGPFPRPTELRGQRLTQPLADTRASDWIGRRQRGFSPAEIAKDDGVSTRLVNANTRDFGPFPAPEVLEAWVAGRASGRSIAAIAEQWEVPPRLVRRHTEKYGPFPAPRQLPEGVLGMATIAAKVGLRPESVRRWRRVGLLPEPDFVTQRGRPVWLPGTIERWLDTAGLVECPECGALCRSLGHHRQWRHGA